MKTVLFIGAHPDDIEFGCGGAVQYYIEKGYRAEFLVFTSGEEGSLNEPKALLKKRREIEAIKSSRILGAEEVHFLNFDDGLTYVTKEMKQLTISKIRQIKPEIVFTHSPQDSFPDHKILGQLTLSSITAASGPWYQDVGGAPHTVNKVFGYEVWNPCNEFNISLDITPYIETKVAALNQHESQTRTISYQDAAYALARYRGVMTSVGQYAEVFDVIKDHL